MTNEPQTYPTQEKRATYVFFFTVIGISIVLIVYIWLQPWAYKATSDRLGIAGLPTIYLAIAGIASLLQILVESKNKNRDKQQMTEEQTCPFWPVAVLSAVVLVSAVGIWRTDPVITCSLLVLILMLIAGIRDWRLLSGLSLGTGLMLYLLFIRVLGVFFPSTWLQ